MFDSLEARAVRRAVAELLARHNPHDTAGSCCDLRDDLALFLPRHLAAKVRQMPEPIVAVEIARLTGCRVTYFPESADSSENWSIAA